MKLSPGNIKNFYWLGCTKYGILIAGEKVPGIRALNF